MGSRRDTRSTRTHARTHTHTHTHTHTCRLHACTHAYTLLLWLCLGLSSSVRLNETPLAYLRNQLCVGRAWALLPLSAPRWAFPALLLSYITAPLAPKPVAPAPLLWPTRLQMLRRDATYALCISTRTLREGPLEKDPWGRTLGEGPLGKDKFDSASGFGPSAPFGSNHAFGRPPRTQIPF